MSAVDTGLCICMFTGHVRALRPELEETEMNFKCISINWCNILSISDCIRFRSHCWSDASYASVLKPQASGPIGPRWTICRTVLFLDPNKGQQTSNDNPPASHSFWMLKSLGFADHESRTCLAVTNVAHNGRSMHTYWNLVSVCWVHSYARTLSIPLHLRRKEGV